MQLLFVENHAVFARTAVEHLLQEHEVVLVPSLAAARHALARWRFDVLLVDFDLDDGKGEDLVRELVAAHHPARIVAISAHADGNAALRTAGAHFTCAKADFPELPALLVGGG